MPVKPVSDNSKHIIKTSVAAGAVTTAITCLQNRDIVSASVKNTLKGKDRFVLQAKSAALETMKNTGKKLDLETVAKNAGELYGMFPAALKSIGKSFAATTVVCAAGLAIGTKIAGKITEKQNQKAQSTEQA